MRLRNNRFFSTPQAGIVFGSALFMLTSMLIIGAYMAGMMYKRVYELTYERMQIYTQRTTDNIDQSLSFVDNTTMAVATTPTVLSWIDNSDKFASDNSQRYANITQLRDELKHILSYSNAWQSGYIGYIAIFYNDQLLMYSYARPLPESEIIHSATAAYARAHEQFDPTKPYVYNMPPFVNDSKMYHLRTMRSYANSGTLSIMIATDEQTIRSQITDDISSVGSRTYLLDASGNIFSSTEEFEIGTRCPDELLAVIMNSDARDIVVDGTHYIAFAQPVEGAELTLATLVPRDDIIGQALQDIPILITISLLLCACLVVSSLLVSIRSTRFVGDLTQALDAVKNKDYDVRMAHYDNASVNALSDSFNSMTSSMKTLINDKYKSRIMLQEMELEFIQQQVNPHFLFNILAIIQIKAKLCADETVYEMLTSLSGLLRAGLYSDKNISNTVGEELKYVSFYLYLQKQRYEDMLEYSIDLDRFDDQSTIPRLTIEPIVENAVIHGMKGLDRALTVSVQVRHIGEFLEIEVRDNGVGFDTQQLQLDNLDLEAGTRREKIGLRNTDSRLRLMYGERYSMTVSSTPRVSTVITLRIPPS